MVLIKPKFYLSMLTVVLFTITALGQQEQAMKSETRSDDDSIQTSKESPVAFRPRFSVQPSKSTSTFLSKLLKVDSADPLIKFYLNNSTSTYNPIFVTVPPFSLCQVFPNTKIPFHKNCVALMPHPSPNSKETSPIQEEVVHTAYRHRLRFSVRKSIYKSSQAELLVRWRSPILMHKCLHKIVKRDHSQQFHKSNTILVRDPISLDGIPNNHSSSSSRELSYEQSDIAEKETNLKDAWVAQGISPDSLPKEMNNESLNQTSMNPTTDLTMKTERLYQTQEPLNTIKSGGNPIKKDKDNTELVNCIVVSFLLIVGLAVMVYTVSMITNHQVELNCPRQQGDIALTSNLLAYDKEYV